MPILKDIQAWMNSAFDRIIQGGVDFERAKTVLPFVYYALFFIAFSRLEGLDHILKDDLSGFDPRWPLFWAHSVGMNSTVTMIFVGLTMFSLIAAIFPFSRIARSLAFVGMFEFHAYMASFGGPNHQWDHWLWILFILIFLPTVKKSASSLESKRIFSLVFWSAQTFLLMTYSMAGLQKVVYGFIQLAEHQVNAFSIQAAAVHIATELLQMDQTTLLGPPIVFHPWIGWIPFLVVLYLQFFAVVVAFRPSLHRLWGIGLILFHIGTFLTMRAVFTAPSALIMILLLASPFAPSPNNIRNILSSLPIFGWIYRRFTEAID